MHVWARTIDRCIIGPVVMAHRLDGNLHLLKNTLPIFLENVRLFVGDYGTIRWCPASFSNCYSAIFTRTICKPLDRKRQRCLCKMVTTFFRFISICFVQGAPKTVVYKTPINTHDILTKILNAVNLIIKKVVCKF